MRFHTLVPLGHRPDRDIRAGLPAKHLRYLPGRFYHCSRVLCRYYNVINLNYYEDLYPSVIMKYAVAILALVAAAFAAPIAAPEAAPAPEPEPQGTYASYGMYSLEIFVSALVVLVSSDGNINSLGTYKPSPQPPSYGKYGAYGKYGKYASYGTYKREPEAEAAEEKA